MIIEILIDSKLEAMKQCLGERILQAIQEQLASLRIDSTKLIVQGQSPIVIRQQLDQLIRLLEAIHCIFIQLIRIIKVVEIAIQQYQGMQG